METPNICKNNKEQHSPHPEGAPPPEGSGFKFMANEKISKGLLLYFSTLDCIEKIDDAELGKFIKTEMNWLAGNTDEPEYEEMGSFFLHSRIKEQIALRGYDAERKRKSRENKKTAQEPEPEIEVSTYTPTEEEMPTTLIPEESPKPTTTEYDEWLIALRDDNGQFSSSRQTTFNKYWQNFYEDREEALQDVRYYLKNNKVHASLA